ncbi:MAG: hypothetical protein SGARI_006087 [Bacillariaceae sp.]
MGESDDVLDDSGDGWDDDDDDEENVDSAVDQKKALLESLQEDRRQSSKGVQATSATPGSGIPQQERDMFIPIFALVSLAGLFGAYGYEMLRLASRGELYLPWNIL